LKNLGYFKTAKITNEPGSAPDRVIVNVDVEETSTGEFALSGGYSTADGFIAEVSVGERNLLGNGQYVKAAVQYGQRARGFDFSFVEPYLLGYRVAGGLDIFYKQQLASTFQTYESQTIGGAIRLGLPITDEISAGLRYSIYEQQIEIGAGNNCFPASATCIPVSPSIRQAVNEGAKLVSLVGYTLTYNTLDNNRNPTKGLIVEFKQDFAGVGGDVNFVRSTGDTRFYYDVTSELIGMFRLQGGHITPWGGQDLRLLDHFFMGPNLVRGFTVAGIGPRDLTPGSTRDALGGTLYWGATAELQYPLFFAPKDFGMKAALFADAGWLGEYKGVRTYQGPNDLIPQTIVPTESDKIRSSVGAGLIWDSPFGPLRFDYAVALTKESYDRTQAFRFSGGTKF
jgi:outer membrane protein insertion porin family